MADSKSFDATQQASRYVQIERICAEFESAWKRGERPELENYLRFVEAADRGLLLRELLTVELDQRVESNQPIQVEDYRARFPDLEPIVNAVFASMSLSSTPRDSVRDTAVKPAPPRPRAPDPRMQAPEILPDRTMPPAPALFPQPTVPMPGMVISVGEGYRLVKQIGQGAYGKVWHAIAPGGIDVAIKIVERTMSNEAAAKELEALELLKTHRHPYLLTTHAFWQLEDQVIIVMELAEGSLYDRLKECRAQKLIGVPRDELLVYFKESAEALDYLHEHQVQHRDIKPQNILRIRSHSKVADFGIARTFQSSQTMMQATSIGTPSFMPPEVWKGGLSPQSDQYSLAVSYVLLRIDRLPFTGQDQFEMMGSHIYKAPDLDPIPKPEQEVLHRALSKDPRKRYPTCSEFIKALEVASAPPKPPEPKLRRRVILAVIVLAAGTVGGLGWNWISPPAPLTASLPDGLAPAENAQLVAVNAYQFHDKIVRTFDNGLSLEFVLIPGRSRDDPRTFYISTTKIPNDIFAQFAATKPEAVSEEWKKGAIGAAGDLGIEGPQAKAPVFRVSHSEAEAFANWIGGRLPDRRQWDKAAGALPDDRQGRQGPYDPAWQASSKGIAVNRGSEGPLPAGSADNDVSVFGCRDMSGNGLEWTRDVDSISHHVYLRGCGYDYPTPFRFDEDQGRGGTDDPSEQSPYTSFRVVIEPKLSEGESEKKS